MTKWIKNKLVSYLFCVPDINKVLEYKPIGLNGFGGKVYKLYINGEQLADVEVEELKREVKYFENTKLYQILQNNLKEAANKTMFDNAKVIDDMFFGKGILYGLSMQKNILNIIREIKNAK